MTDPVVLPAWLAVFLVLGCFYGGIAGILLARTWRRTP